MSGVGDNLNHSWKNRLSVGVITSAKVSRSKLAPRSPIKGRTSSGCRGPRVEGVLAVEVSRSPEDDVVGVRDNRSGRNSAGPVGFSDG
jgi:hypothetical protein